MTQAYTKHEAEATQDHTIVGWFHFCREECETFLERNPREIGGFDENGHQITVKIDESKYFHRKYHRGHWREGHWVFGRIERGSGKCFLVEVENRNAATLEAIILQYVLPGTHIVSDGWRAYGNLDTIGGGIYTHSVIIHESNFVDPDNHEVHTQNIENMWMRAKRELRQQFSTSRVLFPSYLHEFLYRHSFQGQNIFEEFLITLSENYPA
jgi:transposase-like protein